MEEIISEHRIQQAKNPNPDDVAKCLINLATDGAVLSRAYIGYKPYV